MKKLKKQYKAKVIRYNFGDPFSSMAETYDKFPTEKQLEDLLKKVNKEDSYYKDFETRIEVVEYWQVVNAT
jgi:hypothetical protein